MSNTQSMIFKGLQIVAWVIFIGLCIEAGRLILNFIFTVVAPENLGDLNAELDLQNVYQRNRWAFYGIFSFLIVIAGMKAHLFYEVIRLVSALNLSKPFSAFAARQISRISYATLAIGFLSHIARQTANNLEHKGYEISDLSGYWVDSQAYILMAAVLYVIATIFKKGIALQEENDLTV